MAKFLVIGASGWIGGHMVDELLTPNHEVRCLSRQPSKIQALAHKGCDIVQG